MIAKVHVLVLLLLTFHPELHSETLHDQTASHRFLPDVAGIISFGISAEFPMLLSSYCQGTLLRKTMRDKHDCEYVIATAAHCISNPTTLGGIQYEAVTPKITSVVRHFERRLAGNTSHWVMNSKNGLDFETISFCAFFRFLWPGCRCGADLEWPFPRIGNCSLQASITKAAHWTTWLVQTPRPNHSK